MTLPTLAVSRATAGFIQRGHPWVRPDRFTGSLAGLRSGDACLLVDDRGIGLACALADPGAAVCARVYSTRNDRLFEPVAAANTAWERRAALHADPATDCYRLVHGEADGLPGLRVERLGRWLSATVTAACILPHLDGVLTALGKRLPGCQIVVHEHLDDLQVAEVRSRRWPDGAVDATAVAEGRELGVRFPLRPGAGIASGLYVDQRANRAWLRRTCAGVRVLNLFAYTGAFSLSLLAAGADDATDVDLSAPALERASEAARLNGVESRHRTVRSDARAFCQSDTGSYGIIVIDPPTSAQGGEGGWVARRDYKELLKLAWARLAPGGTLLATSNQVGKPFPLYDVLVEACPGGQPVHPPGLGADIPQVRGFPESVPFRSAAIKRG